MICILYHFLINKIKDFSKKKLNREMVEETSKKTRQLNQSGHDHLIYDAKFSSNKFYVASGSMDSIIRLLNVKSGNKIMKFQGLYFIFYVNFSSNGKYVISCSMEKITRLWDIGIGKQIQTFEDHSNY
ncbi:hypothetical protein RFI_34882, partial [Reticulomyxa filosa]